MNPELAALLERIKGQLDPADYQEVSGRLTQAAALVGGLREITADLKAVLETSRQPWTTFSNALRWSQQRLNL